MLRYLKVHLVHSVAWARWEAVRRTAESGIYDSTFVTLNLLLMVSYRQKCQKIYVPPSLPTHSSLSRDCGFK